MGKLASRKGLRRLKVGTSSTGGGASKNKPGAELPSGQGGESREDLACDPPNGANIGTAEDENEDEGIDAADTKEESAVIQLSELGNDDPDLICAGTFGQTDLRGALAKVERETVKLAFTKLELVWDVLLQNFQDELSKERKRSRDLTKSQESAVRLVVANQENDETKLRHNKEALLAKDREVERLGSIIEEKEKALAELQSSVDGFAAEVQKLRCHFAVVEKKSAQESLTSGTFTEGCANPRLLGSAAQNVDRAMDILAKFLYNKTLMRGASLKTPELASLIDAISPASPGDFTRPVQMKYVWGHWICSRMFQGFEHVYFDVSSDRTSPLNLEKHALDCFRTYQEKKDVASLDYFKECGFFRKFCTKIFSLVFSAYLVDDARIEDSAKPRKSVSSGFGGGWEEPGELKRLFLDVAKAIWMLHELAFSFHPPASILRMGRGEPFDDEYQEAVIKDEDNLSMKVVLMLRPGFRVKKSVVKSRVFLSKTLTLN